ncbi:MAG: GNAT family N-acetyltransferase [Sphingobacteriia bacterium]|nr:GNAT family N-acetyltransferase [Sphingobacteriia bacterium]
MITSLENPVWEALSSKQQHFNRGTETVKYFPEDVSPFIGMKNWDEAARQEMLLQLPEGRSFSVMIAREVQLPAETELIFSIPLYQMYCSELKPVAARDLTVRQLGYADVSQMLELTELTKPGPFYSRTIEFGNYIGLYKNNRLISMAGERLKTDGYTEISAICTSPEYLGNGYASYLTAKVAAGIFQDGSVPFLHVRTDNTTAINVYRKLGFQVRADVYFAVFKKRG